MGTISDCKYLNFSKIKNRAGNITILENGDGRVLPFDVKRVFYLFDIPSGQSRGAHAHMECHQLLIAASGSFEVHLNDSKGEKVVYLNRPDMGLYVPPGIWASERGFSSGSICLVLASHLYDERDYIREYGEFLIYCGNE
ncbi:FdtA/QdtA family cupin domain-containing protein [Marinilongibacter aquaticus]|uniref:sugar 3,4-ketoisomerase n=1 Tax=Marinilongibacter aquaticus TaxID=2975157 RepID=UPI0021BD38CA|nr:FdtA/QdtA family cupin domain-containing protein [Marinilongibacter aquaticus]UBM57636.1 FdtA/QdtA family cupin domain-containing protein [Marinilongibacter aquaticus]